MPAPPQPESDALSMSPWFALVLLIVAVACASGWSQAFVALHDRKTRRSDISRVIIFYDGACGICSRFVRILLAAGIPDGFVFASQQGQTWQTLLNDMPQLKTIDSVAVLTEPDGARQVRLHSHAVLWTLTQLRFPFALAWLGFWVPSPLRDVAYKLVASNRARLSKILPGNACPLLPEELRGRMLD